MSNRERNQQKKSTTTMGESRDPTSRRRSARWGSGSGRGATHRTVAGVAREPQRARWTCVAAELQTNLRLSSSCRPRTRVRARRAGPSARTHWDAQLVPPLPSVLPAAVRCCDKVVAVRATCQHTRREPGDDGFPPHSALSAEHCARTQNVSNLSAVLALSPGFRVSASGGRTRSDRLWVVV